MGEFRQKWRYLKLVTDTETIPLPELLDYCLGEHKGGLLFRRKGKDEVIVIKCDDKDDLYRREGNLEETKEEWILMGAIIDDTPPFPF